MDRTPVGNALFSYIRYNLDISADGLKKTPGLEDIDAKKVAKLDAVKAMDDLTRIGKEAAEQVALSHFEGFAARPNSPGNG